MDDGKKRYSFRLTEKAWKEYKKMCVDNDTLVSYEIDKLIKKELDRYKPGWNNV